MKNITKGMQFTIRCGDKKIILNEENNMEKIEKYLDEGRKEDLMANNTLNPKATSLISKVSAACEWGDVDIYAFILRLLEDSNMHHVIKDVERVLMKDLMR